MAVGRSFAALRAAHMFLLSQICTKHRAVQTLFKLTNFTTKLTRPKGIKLNHLSMRSHDRRSTDTPCTTDEQFNDMALWRHPFRKSVNLWPIAMQCAVCAYWNIWTEAERTRRPVSAASGYGFWYWRDRALSSGYGDLFQFLQPPGSSRMVGLSVGLYTRGEYFTHFCNCSVQT